MLNRYEKRFSQLRAGGKHAFIPFTILGWPDKETSLSIIKTMIESGASALELGLAFSDPMADGPVIQKAAHETLQSGFKVADAFELIQQVRKIDGEIPIGLLVYYNMVLAHGVDNFFAMAAEAGVDGILIADLSAEFASEIKAAADKHAIQPIFIISPLTTKERLSKICEYAGGFLYAVSRLGVTGVEERYDQALQSLIEMAHQLSKLPVCVGFGVSTAEQARKMIALGADGAITGSKVIDLVRHANGKQSDVLASYLRDMVAAVSAK
jgi:tryptophan synthase alpha chain